MSIIWYVKNTVISCLWLVSIYTQSFLDYTVGWLGKHHFLYVLFYIRYDYVFNKKQKHLSTMCLTQISVNRNISLYHTQARHEQQHTCSTNHLDICPMFMTVDDSSLPNVFLMILTPCTQPTKPPKQLAEGGDLHKSISGRPSVSVAIPAFTTSLGTITDTLNYNWDCAYDNDFPSWLKTPTWANWRPLAQ
jgi:hypothetical protein